ncbi:amidohydrolase 2 [Lophiostoma macrostomum CBS 122681]|uniref:Amidohydrolase 2 n=1 Tax=Lophiostoma macrostomum CBS 122681 TaxID=1314788 RepID=A0A6A6T7J1_9PLEO|nr:amidohydrolase 2 [Lophiostoma macrostomum CBS 122681]
MANPTSQPLPRSITLEEHFTSQAFESSAAAKSDPLSKYMPQQLLTQLADLTSTRIQNMDDNGVALQIVSHSPSATAPASVIRASNDELSAAIQANPKRLAGFANLRMLDAADATAELERCVKDLGFLGALVDNHAAGNFYDGADFEAFWAKAVELDVPIYLHPTFPSDDMNAALYSGGALDGNAQAAMGLGAFVFGWHASTATTVLRLLASKLFDKHPTLKIVIGHFGELLPYMFSRIDKASARVFGCERGFAEVMHSNVWVTTSGMFDTVPLRCLLGVMPRERVLFSVDYPFSDNRLGKEFLERVRREGVLEGSELDDFAYGNAVRLLFRGKSSEEVLGA